MKALILLVPFLMISLQARAVLDPIERDPLMDTWSDISQHTIVKVAQERAVKLYGEEYGFLGATSKILTSNEGKRYIYINVRGDGNCGFYAAGVPRERFIEAIENLTNKHHDAYMEFLKQRDLIKNLVSSLSMSPDSEILTVIKTEANKLKSKSSPQHFSRVEESLALLESAKDRELFAENRRIFSNSIDNLAYPVYEAFIESLRNEMEISGVPVKLEEKSQVMVGVRTVFERNKGSNSWLPGGLLGAIKDILGLEFNIWSKLGSKNGLMRLFQGTGPEGFEATGPGVRNIFFTGGHYDMLLPLLPE